MKALIFDMDGVVIDSEIHWQSGEDAFLKKLIPGWTDKDHAQIMGLSIQDTHVHLQKNYGLLMSRDEFLEEVDKIAVEIYAEKAGLLEGFYDFIQRTRKKNGLLTGLASSARKHWIKSVMTRLDLYPLFDAVVSSEDLEEGSKGKPAPDIYLFTAKKLGVAPKDCVVIEDAHNGVLAAKAAGMFCIGLRNGIGKNQDLSSADAEARGFAGIKAF